MKITHAKLYISIHMYMCIIVEYLVLIHEGRPLTFDQINFIMLE